MNDPYFDTIEHRTPEPLRGELLVILAHLGRTALELTAAQARYDQALADKTDFIARVEEYQIDHAPSPTT